ncbi:MAG: periplasmic heavy metal sensor [Rhodospirillales bacterium]|nr:periplasmic heavy metal sensor [Rhodospirillales bacterium]
MSIAVGQPRWRHMRWVIGISLALNLFLLAFLGVQGYRWRVAERQIVSGGLVEIAIDQVSSKLSPEDARILRSAFMSHSGELATLQRQWLLAVEETRRDIGAQPFDAAKFKADLQAVREARSRISPVIEALLLEAIPRMSEAGRQAISRYRLLPPH